MSFEGRVFLYVEGTSTPALRNRQPLIDIWQKHLVDLLGLSKIEKVIPISKKDITVLNPIGPASGVGANALDERIRAAVESDSCDAVVVAWDLQPAWDVNAKPLCKSQELKLFYEALVSRKVLPEGNWREQAQVRLRSLELKDVGVRTLPPRLVHGAILAVIMEPTFESLLLMCDKTIRQILLPGTRKKVAWPIWFNPGRRPEEILYEAIEAARPHAKGADPYRIIHGNMMTAKNDWGELLLRRLIEDPDCKEQLAAHPIARRLVRVMG